MYIYAGIVHFDIYILYIYIYILFIYTVYVYCIYIPYVYIFHCLFSRCIGNHSELAAALSSRFNKDFENISLERTSIYYQYHVFHSASVVIAQVL